MHRIAPIARILLGLTFVVFSLNYFIPFLPAPSTPPPTDALALLGGLVTSKLLTVVKLVELGAGIALLTNRAVPLALALLAPIIVGIVTIHATVMPAGLAIGLFVLALELVLAWSYRSAFAPMLRLRHTADALVPAAGPHLDISPSPAR